MHHQFHASLQTRLQWPPARQAQLQALLSHPGQADCYAAAAQAATHLARLADDGQLLQTDAQGLTTLDHLTRLQNQPAPAGLCPAELTAELISNLAEPRRICQQDRGTCTVTTLQYLHARSRPADHARLTVELLGSGKARFAGGDTLHRNATGVDPDSSGRRHLDRILQSSLMNAAYQGIAFYDNRDDAFYTTGGRQFRGSGLYTRHVDYLMGQLFNQKTRVMDFDNDPKIFEADLTRARQLGHQVYVALNWSPDPHDKHSSHALAFEKFEGDQVHLRNPWGDEETGGANGPLREVTGPGGQITLSRATFFEHLTDAVRPSRPFYHVWTNRLRYWITGA